MTRRYRVAVVGLGIGQRHIEEAYAKLGHLYELALLCDLDRARLDEACAMFGVPGTTSFDEVLGRDDIDIVDICTPSFLHAGQASAVLAAGKHAIVEKPLARSLDEIAQLRRAAAGATGRLMPIFQYRWGRGAQAARAVIDAGLAGRPLIATAETHWTRDAEYYSVGWRGTVKGELGGAMTTHAIHMHDMLCWFFGPVSSVMGRAATLVHGIETEDTASASLRFANGAMASLSVTVASPVEYSRLFMAFEHVAFESTRYPYAFGRGPWTITAADPMRQAEIDALVESLPDPGDRFGGQMAAFHHALETGGPVPVSIEDAEASIMLLSGFYRAARTGAAVALPLPGDDPLRQGWTGELEHEREGAHVDAH